MTERKYFKPKSVAWWGSLIPLVAGVLIASEPLHNWDALADAGTISEQDLELFKFVESADEAIQVIETWSPVPARQNLPGRER